jgi:hypothetical protein
MSGRGKLTPYPEERFRQVASSLGLNTPVQEVRSA